MGKSSSLPSHQIQLHGLLRDPRGRHLDVVGQLEVAAEARHEVGGGDQLEVVVQRVPDDLVAAGDLLLRLPGHRADLDEGAGSALHAAGEVETGGGLGLGTPATHALGLEHVGEDLHRLLLDPLVDVDALRHLPDHHHRLAHGPVVGALRLPLHVSQAEIGTNCR